MACEITQEELSCYFPFLPKVGEFLQRRGLVLDSVVKNNKIVEIAISRLKSTLSRGFPPFKNCIENPEETAAAVRLALYIAAATKNAKLVKRFADFESKIFINNLRKVRGIQNLECKIYLGKLLGIYAKPTREVVQGFPDFSLKIAVRWTSYLKYAPQDPHWAMINRPVIRGWVLLPEEDFERLMEEAYEAAILALVEENELAVGAVASAIDLTQLKELEKYSHAPLQYNKPAEGPDPPCMKAIMEALKAGDNLPHVARFAIATYLLKRGWDVEEVVNIFRNAPDFNEKITRYQVQHIAGQVGGRKEYSVPSCETMNTWGLCPTNLGCGIKNPIQYGRRIAVKKSS